MGLGCERMSRRSPALWVAAASFVVFLVLAGVFWAETNTNVGSDSAPWSRLAGALGGVRGLPVLTILVAALLGASGRWVAARFLLLSVVGAGVLMYAARVALQALGADDDGGRLSDYPSGHVAVVTAFGAGVAVIVWGESRSRLVRVVCAVLALSVIVVMSAARLDTGAHTVLDVMGGAALGLACVALCIAWAPPSGVRSPTREHLVRGVLASATIGFVLLALVYEREPLASVDADVAEWIAESLPGAVASLAGPLSWLGGWIGLTMLTGAAVVFLARERSWSDVGLLLAAVVGSRIAVALLEARIDRPRPHVGSAVSLPDSTAFPSGYATAGVVAFGALAVLAAERLPHRRACVWLWCGAAVVGLAVGLSRIALNVNFVADVLAGWCFGLAWLAACLLLRERLRASG